MKLNYFTNLIKFRRSLQLFFVNFVLIFIKLFNELLLTKGYRYFIYTYLKP